MPHMVDRATFRSLRRSPGFTAMAVLSLGLAVGLTTTTFGVVDAVRHPYVPIVEPERLYSIGPVGMDANRHPHRPEMYVALRNQAGFYEAVAATTYARSEVTVRGVITSSWGPVISTNYFSVLGVKPYLGRDFRPADADGGADPVAIVSYQFWQKWVARSPALAKTPVMNGDVAYTVIGVMEPAMGGTIWTPMSHRMGERAEGTFFVNAIVRLKPSVTKEQVVAQLHLLAAAFGGKYGMGSPPLEYRTDSFVPRPGHLSDFHAALGAAAFIVLLIACANVANLLVARVITKRRDIAVRMALGASQSDVAGYVLGESIVLSAAGGAIGILLAIWGSHLVQYRLSVNVPQLGTLTPQLSWRVCLFALVVITGTVALIAAAAIRRARATGVSEAMKEGSGSTTHRSGGVYRGLVVAEVALSLVVLMGAALCLRATAAVGQFDFGYDVKHLLTAYAFPPVKQYNSADSLARFFDGIAAGARAVPGVRAVATETGAAVKGSMLTSDVGGATPRQLALRGYHVASPEYFSTLGIPIIEGRDFQPGDGAGSTGAAIVDDSSAKRLWPHESPVGHMLKLGDIDTDAPWVRVIGVVRSVRNFNSEDPDAGPQAGIYVERPGVESRYRTIIVRTGSDDAGTRLALSRYFRTAAPGGRIEALRPWLAYFDLEVQLRQFLSIVFTLIAAFALGLSTVGLYSVLAYTGAQRTREYAMRIALGARAPDLLRLVLREAFLLVIGGTAVGGIVAMWGGRLLERWLYSVDPMDAVALVSAEAVLMVVCFIAALGPAMRATRANPIELLRAT